MRGPRSNRPDDEGAVCQAAADLIRSELLVPRSPALHPRQWAAIESSLGRRRRARRVACWSWRLAAPALAACVAALWAVFGTGRPHLDYATEGCQISTDARTGAGTVTTAAGDNGRIVFSDGSTIALDGGTRGRLVVPDRSSSAELVLERGAAELSVVHRADTRWSVEAGPFRIAVKGTRFHVSWSPPRRHFRLDLRQGEVTVSGRPLATALTLRSGQGVEVIDGQVIVAGAAPAQERQSPSETPPDRPTGASTTENDAPTARAEQVAIEAPGATAADDETPPGATSTETAPRKDNDTMRTEEEPARISRAARTVGVAAALGALGLATPTSVDAAAPRTPGTPVAIGSDGKLDGPMTGYAWVAAGVESTIDTPSPCNARGCFRDTRGALCTRGTIPALRCTTPGNGTDHPNYPNSCNWDTNWGVMIGMNTTGSSGPWLSAAPLSLSLAYHGRDESAQSDRGRYRMNVHIAGDPESKVYCIDTYVSGQVVEARMLRTDCWTDSGESLSSFQQVDKVGLQLPSTESATPFDYCITAIAVNGPALPTADTAPEGDHIAIGSNGKLGGEMTGYAWVAGGGGTTFRTPQPCNDSGCFRNTQGRLCASGAIAALSCSSSGPSQPRCDWQTNWGAMIGLNANLVHGAWGATAPSTVALTFSGPRASYRLVAHVAGAPDSELFCLEGYSSGQPVAAGMLRSRCWSSSGEALSSFEQVDQLGLLLASATDAVSFDLCISDVVVR
jgi:ferric-dicitrate binding protein FerR (iron transport regulator)